MSSASEKGVKQASHEGDSTRWGHYLEVPPFCGPISLALDSRRTLESLFCMGARKFMWRKLFLQVSCTRLHTIELHMDARGNKPISVPNQFES